MELQRLTVLLPRPSPGGGRWLGWSPGAWAAAPTPPECTPMWPASPTGSTLINNCTIPDVFLKTIIVYLDNLLEI